MVRFLLLLISHLVFVLYQGTSKLLMASSPEEPHCRLANWNTTERGRAGGRHVHSPCLAPSLHLSLPLVQLQLCTRQPSICVHLPFCSEVDLADLSFVPHAQSFV